MLFANKCYRLLSRIEVSRRQNRNTTIAVKLSKLVVNNETAIMPLKYVENATSARYVIKTTDRLIPASFYI